MERYIILDLEATCWENRSAKHSEIIEIGAVCVDQETTIQGEFQTFIRPKLHPTLSDFCVELTHIEQEMIDQAPMFPEGLAQFQAWIQGFDAPYWLASWGFYDRKQLTKDCQLHQLDIQWMNRHISLKHQYAQFKRMKRAPGMKMALYQEGLELEGTHHRGIDDARNIARIFIKCFDKWAFEE